MPQPTTNWNSTDVATSTRNRPSTVTPNPTPEQAQRNLEVSTPPIAP